MPRAVVALTLGLGCIAGAGGCSAESHVQGEALARYPVTTPLRQDTELSREYVAQIRAHQRIEVRALERGYLDDIFVDEGQHVKKGQRMFQIMPTVYRAEYQKAAAEAEFAEIEYQNTKSLHDGNVVSPNELALAKAKLDKARAERDLAQVHLGLTEIRAPFDGIMGRLEARRGSLLDEGELVTTLADNSQMWVYFNVTEAEYLDYQSQLADDEVPVVRLRMANGKLFEHEGRVETIEADFNNETGNIAFRATFPNPDGLLRHGETGKVVMGSTLEDALLIPQKATFDLMDKKFVFLVDDEGVLHSHPIEVLEELPHLYVVGSGLQDDDHILLEGLRNVRDGDEIEVELMAPDEVAAHLDVPAE